jgi:hypothetical protein
VGVGPERLSRHAVAHGRPFLVAEWAVRHEWSTLTPAQQTAWLEAAFDYFESHPAIKAISYFNYNNRPGGRVAWDAARAVYLYDGKVSYLPNVDDHDHRLLAYSGDGWRTLYARRISSARYVSAVASTSPRRHRNRRRRRSHVSTSVARPRPPQAPSAPFSGARLPPRAGSRERDGSASACASARTASTAAPARGALRAHFGSGAGDGVGVGPCRQR